MINRLKKGNRRQNQSRHLLEKEGWRVYVARRGYQGEAIDIFSLWDIIAYRDGFFKLVQVKSNYISPKDKQPLIDFFVDGEIVTKEIWVWKDYDRKNPHLEVLPSRNSLLGLEHTE